MLKSDEHLVYKPAPTTHERFFSVLSSPKCKYELSGLDMLIAQENFICTSIELFNNSLLA